MSEKDLNVCATPEDKIIEFQPDALELKNQRLPLGIKLCVWLPFVVLVSAIIWACIAKVDVVIPGSGKLVTNTPTIVMKPLERSVIKVINVRIGDIVRKGQILITFDPTINNAEASRLKNELGAYTAEYNRLRAEFSGVEYKPGSGQFEQWQKAIYDQRQRYFRERMTYFDEAVAQVKASIKSKGDSLNKQRERLAAVQQLEDMFRKLHESKVTSLKELIQMSISRMEMEATVDQLENELLELQHRLGSLQAEKNSFIQEWLNSVSENMVQADRNRTSIAKEYDKVARLIEYVYLRAPCDAVVHEIAAFSPGSAVQEAEALITLIPIDGNIELEGEIRPQDIGKVKVGSPVRVKLTAFPFQKHGTLNGVVRNISENTIERSGGQMPVSYFRARISISGQLNKVPDDFRLIPGMEAQCEIKCDTRRVITYILYPLIKALDETAREP